MRPDRPSDTAEMVCSWRALEHLLPEADRIVDDPYARAFLGPVRGGVLDAVERLPPRAVGALFRRVDRLLRGVMTFVLARHRAMDDALQAHDGLEQVVLLGAGYDTRSVRLAEALKGARVFEVDHPATAARKQRLAADAFAGLPRAELTLVSVDFAREAIADKLTQAGFLPGRRTFWIWEGVSMYLEEAAVRETLRMIASLSAPGALLMFDAWCPPHTGLPAVALRDLPSLAMKLIYSEPFVGAIPRDRLEPMVRAEGLALIEDLGADQLAAAFGRRLPRWLRGFDSHMRLCTAEVERAL